MLQIPANLAQRILDAARIAAAIHLEQDNPDRAPQTERPKEVEPISE